MKNTNIDRALTKSDLANHLQCTPRTIENLMRKGLFPYVKIGKLVRFNLEEVTAALNKRCGRNQGGAK